MKRKGYHRIMSRAAAVFAAAVLAGAMLTVPFATRPARAQIHSEFPALTRPFTSESFFTQSDDRCARLADRGFSVEATALRLSQGGRCGGANAAVLRGDMGGRFALQYRHGRYALSGEATGDGRRGSESREYPVRFAASGVWPEARVFAALVAGCDGDGYAGTDLALEGAPLVLGLPASGRFPADFRPRLIPGARLRMPARGGSASLTPAAALVLDHLPALASSLVLASSVQSEWRDGAAPQSVLLVQVAYSAGPWLLGSDAGVVRRGSRPPSSRQAGLFIHAGYARSLDQRSPAHFVLGVGTDLDVVLRSAWPTSR
jgi:hypothetical protein